MAEMAESPTKVVENQENCCRLCLSVDNHRLFLQGETAKSEGILTSLKQFIGIDLSVKSDEFSDITILQTDLVPRKALT